MMSSNEDHDRIPVMLVRRFRQKLSGYTPHEHAIFVSAASDRLERILTVGLTHNRLPASPLTCRRLQRRPLKPRCRYWHLMVL